MSVVSYQAMLGPTGAATPARVRQLGPDAISTRRAQAKREVRVRLSKAQLRWLREVEELSGKGIDADAVLRALVDLGRELDLDWELLAGGGALRQAVREAVLVRRR